MQQNTGNADKFIQLPGELSFIAVNSSIVNITPAEDKRSDLNEYLKLCESFTDFNLDTKLKSTTGNNVYYTIIPEHTPEFLPNIKQFVIGLVESLFPYNGLFDNHVYGNNDSSKTTALAIYNGNNNGNNKSVNNKEDILIPNPYFDADHIASQIINKINTYDEIEKDKEVYKADLALLIVKLYATVTFLRRITNRLESKKSILNNILLKLQQNPIEYVQSPIYYQYVFINKSCTNFVVAYLNSDGAELAKITRAGEKRKKIKTKSVETIFADLFFSCDEKTRQEICTIVINCTHYCKIVSKLTGKSYLDIVASQKPTKEDIIYTCRQSHEIGLLNMNYFIRHVVKNLNDNNAIIDQKIPIYARSYQETDLSMRLFKSCLAFEIAYNSYGNNFFTKEKKVERLTNRYPTTNDYNTVPLRSSVLYDMLYPKTKQNRIGNTKLAYYIEFLDYYTSMLKSYTGKVIGQRILNYIKDSNQQLTLNLQVSEALTKEAEKKLKTLKIALAFKAHLLLSLGIDITYKYKVKAEKENAEELKFENNKHSLLRKQLFESNEDAYSMISELIVTPSEYLLKPANISDYPLSFQLIFFYNSNIYIGKDKTTDIAINSVEFSSELKDFTTSLLQLCFRKVLIHMNSHQEDVIYDFILFLKKLKENLSKFDELISRTISVIIRDNPHISTSDLLSKLNQTDSYNSKIRLISRIIAGKINTLKTMYNFNNEFCNPSLTDYEHFEHSVESVLKMKYAKLLKNGVIK